ncbi:GIY-YIG nuclease family protein [Candidatus Kaiserbacteria bacterium]|nr:GIY-YIG nuclease family protein [Candidatus Kaiserbacteria bacterium]
MYYVYVLRSLKDGDMYIGSTNDLKRRIVEHNKGEVPATESRLPFKLLYYEGYLAEGDARLRENALKLRGQARNHLLKRIGKSLLQSKS